MDKPFARDYHHSDEHQSVLDSNYYWDQRWNSRAAERARENSPWPAKEVPHA